MVTRALHACFFRHDMQHRMVTQSACLQYRRGIHVGVFLSVYEVRERGLDASRHHLSDFCCGISIRC